MFIMYTFSLTPTASHVKTTLHTLSSVTLLSVYFGMFKIFLET